MTQLALCLLSSFQMGIRCHLSWVGSGHFFLLAFDFRHWRLSPLSLAFFKGIHFAFLSALRMTRGLKVSSWSSAFSTSLPQISLTYWPTIKDARGIIMGDKSPCKQQVLKIGSPNLAWYKLLPARFRRMITKASTVKGCSPFVTPFIRTRTLSPMIQLI